MQKWARGASVRLDWGLPGLCDSDGELVIYGRTWNPERAAFPIFSYGRMTGLEHNGVDVTLEEMEEID